MTSVDKFFDTKIEFDIDKEKQKVIDFIDMKKNQDASEVVFYDKYHEIQSCIGEQFRIGALKNKLWNDKDISNLKPKVVLVETREQMDDWRYLIRFTSSFKNVPNPGRNMKFLVEDESTGKYLGALTVTSDFGDLSGRDKSIGWTREQRYKGKGLNHIAAGQAIIPIQPFGFNFLGGKLMSLLITSDVIRKAWEQKYGEVLVGMTTTSLYGTYSQYNRLPNFKKAGKTTGKIPIKLPKEIINLWMDNYLDKKAIEAKFGQFKKLPQRGIDKLIYKECGLKAKDYETGLQRGVYFCPFYENTNEFLRKEIKKSSLKLRQDFVDYNKLIVDWWKPKAERRFDKLKSDKRVISELHFWDKLFGLSYEEAKINYLGEVGR